MTRLRNPCLLAVLAFALTHVRVPVAGHPVSLAAWALAGMVVVSVAGVALFAVLACGGCSYTRPAWRLA